MKIIETTFEKLPTKCLVIGFEGENQRATVRIDCASVFAEYPNATPTLIVKPLFADAYPVVVDRNGTDVDWLITSEILSFSGDGEIQLVFYKDEVICKSAVSKIRVCRSLQVTGDMPDPVAQWIDDANRKLAEVDAQIVELEGMVDTATDAAERAEQSASTASTKAEQAAGSAATATAKATEAQTAAGTATAKAAEAALSATQASNSAMSAADSERGATAKAAEAAQSAQTAAQKAEQITEAAQIATGKAGEASASATSAQASATDAASSATAASASETAAKASETAASASATQAGTSERNAGTAAQTAMQKAAEATQSATNAETFAGTATTKAEEVAASAQAASDAKTAVEQTAEQLADSLEQIKQNTQDIAELDERKANIDGYYPDMTVGNAEQLNSSKYVENSEPYTLRTSGGSSDIGNREYLDAVVGGTLAWNQMLPNMRYTSDEKGLSFVNNNGSLTITGTIAEAFNYNYVTFTNLVNFHRDGRKYLFLLNHGIPYGWGVGGYGAIFDAGITSGIWTNNAGGDWNNGLVFRAEVGTTVDIHDLRACVFDLTQMLGSAVADYIYNLEQANAGAGLALFRSWFPNDYYEYNAGELLSVEGLQSHDMVGFNLWDEEWELGYIDPTTGVEVSVSNKIRMKNYMRILPSTTYYKKSPYPFWCVYFDENKKYVGYADGNANRTFTTPSNARYMRSGFEFELNQGITYNHDICISLAHNNSRNGEYEPYEKHSYPLDSSVILRGIPKVGANGVYWDGDRYLPDGTVERRYGVVDLGSFDYRLGTNKLAYTIQTAGIIKAVSNNNLANVIMLGFDTITRGSVGYGALALKKGCGVDIAGYFFIADPDMTWTTVEEVKSALSGVLLVYELATPTTETAEAYQAIQLVDDWGTEEYVSGTICPVGHVTRYPVDLVKKLEGLPTDIQVNGVSIVQDGVANVPIASADAYGVVRTGSVSVSGTTPTINALPGVRYICGEVSTITITVPASGIIDVVFTSGSTPAVLTINGTVRWANDFDPNNLDADTVYELNIADGLGVAGAWT